MVICLQGALAQQWHKACGNSKQPLSDLISGHTRRCNLLYPMMLGWPRRVDRPGCCNLNVGPQDATGIPAKEPPLRSWCTLCWMYTPLLLNWAATELLFWPVLGFFTVFDILELIFSKIDVSLIKLVYTDFSHKLKLRALQRVFISMSHTRIYYFVHSHSALASTIASSVSKGSKPIYVKLMPPEHPGICFFSTTPPLK